MNRRRHHRLAARLGLGLLTMAVAAALLLHLPWSAASSDHQRVPHGHASDENHPATVNRFALGVYAGALNAPAANNFGSRMGQPVHFAMDFLNGASWSTISQPGPYLSNWSGSGYSMIWGVPMVPNSGASLAVGATGAYDQYFATLAQRLVAGGQGSSIIRIGWEFNGIWFPWSARGHTTQFVEYWRHIVTTMRSVPGANFTFEWNPSRGDLGAGDLASYYPGDAYVDYVGLDVFDVDSNHYLGAQAEFNEMETEPDGLNWLASFSAQHHKPMVFPEWGLGWGKSSNGAPVSGSGSVSGGDNATFIKDMSQWFSTHDVFEATYWDYGTSTVTGQTNQLAMAALRADWSTHT